MFSAPPVSSITQTGPVRGLKRKPREYWQTNCWLGSSFMTRADAEDREAIGVDKIMWGSDFPHEEGTYPHTREALAHTYAGIDPDEVEQMVGGHAARVYGFDLAQLRAVADRVGPAVDAVFAGIQSIPSPTTSFAFGSRTVGVA